MTWTTKDSGHGEGGSVSTFVLLELMLSQPERTVAASHPRSSMALEKSLHLCELSAQPCSISLSGRIAKCNRTRYTICYAAQTESRNGCSRQGYLELSSGEGDGHGVGFRSRLCCLHLELVPREIMLTRMYMIWGSVCGSLEMAAGRELCSQNPM